jgi:hypothetical protein
MNINAIKSIVKTPAWSEIENYFRDEVLENKRLLNIKLEGKTNEMIATEYMAREMTAKIIDRVLNKLKRLAQDSNIEKQSFK